MPVPKKQQKKYGMIVGKMINSGYGLEKAKDIADRAIKHKNDESHKLYRAVLPHEDNGRGRPRTKCKMCGGRHTDGSGH